jgi:uncharacterized membrane protein
MWRHGRKPFLRVVSFLAIHVAIVKQAPAAAVIVGLGYAIINLVLDWGQGASALRRIAWVAAIMLLTAALAAILQGYASAIALLLAPSVLANLAMLYIFGYTLLPGKEPLITRFRRLDLGHVEPKFIGYTRQLTMLWTILFAAGTLVSLAAIRQCRVVVLDRVLPPRCRWCSLGGACLSRLPLAPRNAPRPRYAVADVPSPGVLSRCLAYDNIRRLNSSAAGQISHRHPGVWQSRGVSGRCACQRSGAP